MSAYKSRPCPGCGKVENRPAGTICRECQDRLSDYDRMKKLASMGRDDVVNIGISEYLPLPKCPGVGKGGREFEDLRDSVSALIQVFAPIIDGTTALHSIRPDQLNDHPQSGTTYTASRIDKVITAPVSFIKAYDRLIFSLRAVLVKQYEHGQNYGVRLLDQLNSGRISTMDFDRRRE